MFLCFVFPPGAPEIIPHQRVSLFLLPFRSDFWAGAQRVAVFGHPPLAAPKSFPTNVFLDFASGSVGLVAGIGSRGVVFLVFACKKQLPPPPRSWRDGWWGGWWLGGYRARNLVSIVSLGFLLVSLGFCIDVICCLLFFLGRLLCSLVLYCFP